MGQEDFVTPLYVDFFKWDGFAKYHGVISFPSFFQNEITQMILSFSQLVIIVDKTTPPNSIFMFNSSILIIFISFMCEMFTIKDTFKIKYSKILMRKVATYSLSSNLFLLSC